MPKVRRRIGRLISDRRKQLGVTGADCARRCNVSRACVYVWERSSFILPKQLPLLAKALRMPLKTLTEANGKDRRRTKNGPVRKKA